MSLMTVDEFSGNYVLINNRQFLVLVLIQHIVPYQYYTGIGDSNDY